MFHGARKTVLAGRTIVRVSKADVQQYQYKQNKEKVNLKVIRSSSTIAEVMSRLIRLQL